MSGTLYAFPNSFRANKILIAAQYSGENVKVDPDFVAGETDKSPEFLKKFPFGKVPAYESGDVKLFETNAIAYHVGNEQTRGGDKEAEVLQWIGVADNIILPLACTWVYPTQGIMQYNKQSTEKAKTDLKTVMASLNEYLETRTFLVGERVTQADISMACTMAMLYQHVFDVEFRAPYGNVNRWFNTLVHQPQFKSVLGDFTLCEKMAQFDAKKYNEIHGKADKKKDTPKTPKGKGAGDSKSPKPASKEQQSPAPAAPKQEKKDPWGHLPPTTYDMDAFKRCYSNEDEDVSLKYFWDHFDKEHYSIWQGSYKFNDELSPQVFMSVNLLRGMTQRLGKMCKHAFGSMGVLSKDDKKSINSLWFWRGHDLAFPLDDNWTIDYESFDWVKLDPDCEVTKKKVKEYWSWEGDFDGWKWEDGKIFK